MLAGSIYSMSEMYYYFIECLTSPNDFKLTAGNTFSRKDAPPRPEEEAVPVPLRPCSCEDAMDAQRAAYTQEALSDGGWESFRTLLISVKRHSPEKGSLSRA